MVTSGPPSGFTRTGTSGKKSSSKALSSSFKDPGICNMRDRIAAKKKRVADEATTKTSTKENAPRMTKKADEEGKKLTKLLDRALHGCVEDTWAMADATRPTTAACTALRPLALKLSTVYKPCALQIKKTELMEGVSDTHGLRSRRKESPVD